MFKAIKNHIIDILVDASHKTWITTSCFFIEKVLINPNKGKGIISGKKLSSTMPPTSPNVLDKELKRVIKGKKEKIKFVYTGSFKQLEHNLRFQLIPHKDLTNEQKKKEIEIEEKEMKSDFKSGLFKLVTEKGKNLYFNVRYLGFILYQIGIKADYLIKHAYYYPEDNLLLIYTQSNRHIMAGIMRFNFEYTDDLFYGV